MFPRDMVVCLVSRVTSRSRGGVRLRVVVRGRNRIWLIRIRVPMTTISPEGRDRPITDGGELVLGHPETMDDADLVRLATETTQSEEDAMREGGQRLVGRSVKGLRSRESLRV